MTINKMDTLKDFEQENKTNSVMLCKRKTRDRRSSKKTTSSFTASKACSGPGQSSVETQKAIPLPGDPFFLI